MQVQFNSDSSVMGTDNVAERIEARVRDKLARFEERLMMGLRLREGVALDGLEQGGLNLGLGGSRRD